jgi:hypothetical protein
MINCHFYTPCSQLAHYLQEEYPNGVVHYYNIKGVIAYLRVP